MCRPGCGGCAGDVKAPVEVILTLPVCGGQGGDHRPFDTSGDRRRPAYHLATTGPCRRDCCQHCCQADRQGASRADNRGMSVQRTDRNGRSRTMCLLRRQKVGGSSPSERAQVSNPLPDPEGAFLLLLGATLGAACACQPPNRAWLIDSRRRARALWTVPLTVPRAWHIGRKATVMRRIRTDR